jgi:hypothetical protein
MAHTAKVATISAHAAQLTWLQALLHICTEGDDLAAVAGGAGRGRAVAGRPACDAAGAFLRQPRPRTPCASELAFRRPCQPESPGHVSLLLCSRCYMQAS